jgi:hypothetical protein
MMEQEGGHQQLGEMLNTLNVLDERAEKIGKRL